MRDLRKKALLESSKTVSRKARSRASTPSSSRATSASRTTSAIPSPHISPRMQNGAFSRENSSDEDLSDTTQPSTTSFDDVITLETDIDAATGPDWIKDLRRTVNELLDKKRSSAASREAALSQFTSALTRHYARSEIVGKIEELVPVLLKSVKSGQTEKETVLALRVLALLIMTDPSDALYDAVADTFKTTISDNEYASAKVAAIRALSIATFYGGAVVEEVEATVEFLLDIPLSDGRSVNVEDNPDVVAAALEEWGFLVTQLEDMIEPSETAIVTFVDQLSSTSVAVQIAAGENLALLFEKHHQHAQAEDQANGLQHHHNGNVNTYKELTDWDNSAACVPSVLEPIQFETLTKTISALARTSGKHISRASRKQLHAAFRDIMYTVEDPSRGPRYSTALDDHGQEFGSRLYIAAEGVGRVCIDRWWKYHRLNTLRRTLREGLGVHWSENEVVVESMES